jgi:hypothetical protein
MVAQRGDGPDSENQGSQDSDNYAVEAVSENGGHG